jgi:hypothetical protein
VFASSMSPHRPQSLGSQALSPGSRRWCGLRGSLLLFLLAMTRV